MSAVERTSSARTGALWQRFKWRVELETWGYAPITITITRLWILIHLVMLRDSWYFLYHFFVSPFLGLYTFDVATATQQPCVITSRHGFKPWLAVETKVFCEMYPCRLCGGTACCWYFFLTGLTAAIRPQNESALVCWFWVRGDIFLWNCEKPWFFHHFLRLLGFNNSSTTIVIVQSNSIHFWFRENHGRENRENQRGPLQPEGSHPGCDPRVLFFSAVGSSFRCVANTYSW